MAKKNKADRDEKIVVILLVVMSVPAIAWHLIKKLGSR